MNDHTSVANGDPDAGFVGGFEGLLFGSLLFIVGTLLVANAWGVVDTKFALDTAARQAVRTYVQAPSAAAAGEEAQEAADQSLLGYGRDPARATIRLVGGTFARCSRVTIEVSYPAPLMDLPWLGRVGGGEPVSAEHSELVDPLRSGVPGSATCACGSAGAGGDRTPTSRPARTRRPDRRGPDQERGTVMMLVPAGFLVLMLLASLSVDSAVAYLGQHQLKDSLTAAAADAATAGLDNATFYRQGRLVLAPAATATALCQSLAAQDDGQLHDLRVEMAVAGPVVEVTATATVDMVFGRVIPGFGTRQVAAAATADAEQGANPAAVALPASQPIDC